VENYFNYFTEIEEHFQKRRGTHLLLSTLDWVLIETWKEAGVPLDAVLRGINRAFERYEQRRSRSEKVNSLAYCAQAVLKEAEDMKEAAVGAERADKPGQTLGFEPASIAAFLRRNAATMEQAQVPYSGGLSVRPVIDDTVRLLRDLADQVESEQGPQRLEQLERRLTVLEGKLYALVLLATPEEEMIGVRAQADRDLAPYRGKMPATHMEQLHQRYIHKRLWERYALPRLSLFYM